MRNTAPTIKFGLSALLSLFALVAFGQSDTLIYNNGALFFIHGGLTDSAIVWVDGHVVNHDSAMINKGKFYVKGDYINHDLSGGGPGIPGGDIGNDGLMILEGDWVNDGTNDPGTGIVRMTEDGMITGTAETTFHDLELTGTTKRTMTINAWINETGTLSLDSGEVATDNDTLFIQNPNTNAISRATDCDPCGFVSSLGDGNLVRRTSLAGEYLFPVGSSIDNGVSVPKYRPVVLIPEGSAVDSFSVRMANNTYIQDFFMNILDWQICFLNQEYYHRINQLGGGNPSATFTIYSSEADGDEEFNMISRRDEPNEMWTLSEDASLAVAPPYERTSLISWTNFAQAPEDAYILGRRFPHPPEVSGEDVLCAFFESTYSVPDNGSTYTWSVDPSEGTIINQTNTQITVVWNEISEGHVSVTENVPNNINNGCESQPTIFTVELYPQPVADFEIIPEDVPGGIFIHDLIAFNDLSVDAQAWSWDFGDGFTHNEQSPHHTFDAVGEYEVMLAVQSGDECVDTLYKTLTVVEGVVVPNVFTPNGDSFNDSWDVRTSDVGDFHVAIYNRWGTLVWETKSPQISWDGTTNAGSEAPAGVYYYYIDKIALNSGTEVVDNGNNIQFQENGFVHLVR